MSTISNILKSFLTQNILGYIGVTLILIVICLGFIYNMRVKKKYENLLNAFNESEWINVSNNEDQKELKFLNSELKAMADDFRKSAIKGTYNINTEVIIQKNIEKKILKEENIFVMDENRALAQQIRPLQLLILNIMPTKVVTETQLLRMLSNTPLQIEVDWIHMASHESKNTPQEHLLAFYKTFEEIKDNKYDGLIITGAPVEKLRFEDVDYWLEMEKILEWSKTHVFSSFFICWASQAALHYFYGIEKHELKEKLTGVYFHHTNVDKMKRKILRGFDYQFYAPHSRYTTIMAEDIATISSLDILAASDEAGVYLIAEKDGSRFFVTGHPEYDPDTLDKEYNRDLAISDQATMPKNYYKNDDMHNEILVKWRSHAYLLFSNWLNYYVYQETPYDLNELESLKLGK